METGTPSSVPLPSKEEAEIVANFVNEEGVIIARQSATNLIIPSIGETVSFGRLAAPDVDLLESGESEFTFGKNVYDVVDVEYTYADIEIESDEEPPVSEFVLVNVFVRKMTESAEDEE